MSDALSSDPLETAQRPHAPAEVHVIGTRIAGFSRLVADDRLRAAALALRREFAIAADGVALTAVPLGSDDRVLIAYGPAKAPLHPRVDLWFEPYAARGEAVWSLGSERHESAIFSEHGIATIAPWRTGEPAPDALVALAGERARAGRSLVIWLERGNADAAFVPDAHTLALWAASLGVEFRPLDARPPSQRHSLQAVPSSRVAAPRAGLDRALAVAAVASVLCATLSGVRAMTQRAAAVPTPTPMAPGELWARSTLAAPMLAAHVRTATYGGGAWVVAMPGLAVEELRLADSALRANGLVVQAVSDPEPRIRVQP